MEITDDMINEIKPLKGRVLFKLFNLKKEGDFIPTILQSSMETINITDEQIDEISFGDMVKITDKTFELNNMTELFQVMGRLGKPKSK